METKKYDLLTLSEDSDLSLAKLKDNPSVRSLVLTIEQYVDDTHTATAQHAVAFGATPNITFLGHVVASKSLYEDPAFAPITINAFMRGVMSTVLNTLEHPDSDLSSDVLDNYNDMLNQIIQPTHQKVIMCLCKYGFVRFCQTYADVWNEQNPGVPITLDNGPYCTTQFLDSVLSEMDTRFGTDSTSSTTLH